jgi:hypothetical protein
MKAAAVMFWLIALAACESPDSDVAGPDAAVAQPDAYVAPEPKPAFKAGESIGVTLAIDDNGIRPTYKSGSAEKQSLVTVSLTETGMTTSCSVSLAPKFVAFGYSSASNRQFKTVIIDFASSTVVDDKCKWDDAWITSKLDEQFGHYEIGFAQARFAEDRPGLDVLLDADKTFSNSTASFTYAGAGTAYSMTADGAQTFTMVEPAPGTLVPAVYKF